MTVAVTLPYPPSVNQYWRRTRSHVYVSRHGRAYAAAVSSILGQAGVAGFGGSELSLMITVHPPDRRRRDLDNVLKALLDAMERAGLYDDDSQISRMCIRREGMAPGGSVDVVISEI